jgi:alpha-ketoglutarate-dependent taurine dioxygenase
MDAARASLSRADKIIDEYAYSERFGPVTPHPSKSTRHPDYPKITMLGVDKFDAAGKLREEIYRRGAEGWHTDGAYNQAPFKATQLYALAVPSRGGNTLFANAYGAYEALPQRLKDRLDGVVGAFAYGGRRGKAKLLDPEDQDWQPVFHPIVRAHPETGRKSLYFDPGKICYFVGIEDEEGDAVRGELERDLARSVALNSGSMSPPPSFGVFDQSLVCIWPV